MGVLSACEPRREVLNGDLSDAIFAADFGELIAGTAPQVYGDARIFFQNTHPAAQLRHIVQTVFARLADAHETGAVLRLSTGFGGGKTHTLMALWHLARNIGDPSLGTELLPAAGRPTAVRVAAVDASKAGLPIFARHGQDEVRSLWGELAYQLKGAEGWHAFAAVDDSELQPTAADIAALFPSGPVLVLLDELVIYMATLSEQGRGNLLAFLSKLLGVVGQRPQTALIVTDPGAQRAYAGESEQLAKVVAVAGRLDEVFSREVSDFDPIGGESAQVIVRRLFDRISPPAAQAASAAYHALYERVVQEFPGTLNPSVTTAEYAERIVRCYPFHPRLLDTAQDRLGAMEDFQKSRGVLRLFARIIRDVWNPEHDPSERDVELIGTGDIDWSSPRIQADLLTRLNRENFRAAVSSDIEGHATELDTDAGSGIHRRVASALLLESIPLQPNSGLDVPDLTLAVLRPDEAGPEPEEAMNRLVGVCWHTYPMAGGRGWQFRYEPNVIKQIEERMPLVSREDARSRVHTAAQGYFGGAAFALRAWPASAKQVPESATLQLALCETEAIARSVCENEDDSSPGAPMPRRFLNAIVAVTATAAAQEGAIERAQRLLAAEQINNENKGESGKLVRDQLGRQLPVLARDVRLQTCRAFDRVVLAGRPVYALEERYQADEEGMLKGSHGQASLRHFLEDKHLIYKPEDTVDVGLFLDKILPGATALPERPDVVTAKALHERFLAAPGLRLIPDGGVVRATILRGLGDGAIVVRTADGRAYDGNGVVAGPDGERRRMQGTLSTLSLDDGVLITRAGSGSATDWLREDEEKGDGESPDEGGKLIYPPPPPPPPGRVTVKIHDIDGDGYAVERPLLELRLTARTPGQAKLLSACAQPLGADTLMLNVNVGGDLKDGGTANFSMNNVKPTNSLNPLAMAERLHAAMGTAAQYEAELVLRFSGGGRAGMRPALQNLEAQLPEGVDAEATFGPPG